MSETKVREVSFDEVDGRARRHVAAKLARAVEVECAAKPLRFYRAEWHVNGKVQHGPQYDTKREAEAFARGVRAALGNVRVFVATVAEAI